jgi:hypothetical protein
VLDLRVGQGVTCHATCFTPGIAAPDAPGHPATGPAPEARSRR